MMTLLHEARKFECHIYLKILHVYAGRVIGPASIRVGMLEPRCIILAYLVCKSWEEERRRGNEKKIICEACETSNERWHSLSPPSC
jgi:hypothetical protein